MDEDERQMARELFDTASMLVAENLDKGIPPMYFIVKDKQMNPLVGAPGVTYQDLAGSAVNIAHEWDADAIMLVCEQHMISIHKNSAEIKDYLDGTKKPSESPDSKPYLTLIYMNKFGDANSLVGEIIQSLNGVRYVPESNWIAESATNMITPWAER